MSLISLTSAEGFIISILANGLTAVIGSKTIPEQCNKLFKKALDEWYPKRPNDIGLTRFKDYNALADYVKGDVANLPPDIAQLIKIWADLMSEDTECINFINGLKLDNLNENLKRAYLQALDHDRKEEEHYEDLKSGQKEILETVRRIQEGAHTEYNPLSATFTVGNIDIDVHNIEFIADNKDYQDLSRRYSTTDSIRERGEIKSEIERLVNNRLLTANQLHSVPEGVEPSQMWKDAKKAFEEGDAKRADEILQEEKIIQEEKLAIQALSVVFNDWMLKASTVMSNGDLTWEERYRKSVSYYGRATKIAEGNGLDPSLVAQASFSSAYNSQKFNKFDGASIEYEKALGIYRGLASENPSAYTSNVATTLNNLAALHSDTGKLEDAEKEYGEALSIRRELAASNPPAYTADVALTLNNLANLHYKTDNLAAAEKEYGEALSIRRGLAASNPSAYTADVAQTLNNLAILHKDTGKLAAAEKEYEEALDIRRELASENPSAYTADVAQTLNNLAILHKDTGKLAAAEKEYEEALGIYRELAAKNPPAYTPYVATSLNNLAILHKNTGKLAAAEEEYEEALSKYRGLAASNPSAYTADVAMTLYNLSNLLYKTGRLAAAEKEIQEVIETCDSNMASSPMRYSSIKEKAIQLRRGIKGEKESASLE